MQISPVYRKTKIIATIGPSCDSIDMLKSMILAGMNVARLNLSHGSFEEHQGRIANIREAADQLNMHVAIMLDTKGIEIRTGKLGQNRMELCQGDSFRLFMADDVIGSSQGVSVTYKKLMHEVSAGQSVLLDDGAIELKIMALEDDSILTEVVHGGWLGHSKSINFPDSNLSISATGSETREEIVRELNFAADCDVEYIAASFIQTANDLITMKRLLSERGANIPIIAKIENRRGVDNLEEIIAQAGGIMVARGDLGVELPFGEVPVTQKMMIRTTVLNGKPVITATQMLASMERNPKPTRAEASDVVNAVLDGSSAVMLSGETVIGQYPVEAVETMATLALRGEASLQDYGYLQTTIPYLSNVVTEAVSQGAVTMAKQLDAAAILVLSQTGFTARLISKHRPETPILAVTRSRKVARQLALNWGVTPILYHEEPTDEINIYESIDRAKEQGYIHPNDTIVVTTGSAQIAGGTDLIRIMTVTD